MENEKNKTKQNFIKLTRKGEISLIVLVVTIIVILILAAAVILTINNNNPIAEANKARYESDVSNMQAVFTNAVAKVMTHNRATVRITAGQINDTISGVKETVGVVSYTVTNAMNSENSSGTIVFDKKDNEETTFYTGKKLPIYAAGETKWYVDSEGNISLEVADVKYGNGEIPPFSQTVASDVGTYYGEKVLNYSTGDTALDTTLTENQVGWQIFYADTSNIYLIATDYVPYNLLPTKKVIAEDGTETVYALNKGDTDYEAYFTAMLPAYNGSEDITKPTLQALNSSYHEYLETNQTKSENKNMKAVAYMLDTEIWEIFKGNNAEYIIGGPTAEMLFKSYNQKYGIKYAARAKANGIGYEISKDVEAETVSWSVAYSGMLDTSDTQYVLKDSNNAYGMWLASPSAGSISNVMSAIFSGNVGGGSYNDYGLGFDL